MTKLYRKQITKLETFAWFKTKFTIMIKIKQFKFQKLRRKLLKKKSKGKNTIHRIINN